MTVTGELHEASSAVFQENEPCMGLMLTQSIKTPRALLGRLASDEGNGQFTAIIENQLYGYWVGRKRSKTRPKFQAYEGPPGKDAPGETDRQRSARQHRNSDAFRDNNEIAHGFALSGIELAARLNANRWGDVSKWPASRYQVRDIRLHPESYLTSFRSFLQEQHVIDLARMVAAFASSAAFRQHRSTVGSVGNIQR